MQYLVELTQAVSAAGRSFDLIMKEPVSPERDQKLAYVIGKLEKVGEVARVNGLREPR